MRAGELAQQAAPDETHWKGLPKQQRTLKKSVLVSWRVVPSGLVASQRLEAPNAENRVARKNICGTSQQHGRAA